MGIVLPAEPGLSRPETMREWRKKSIAKLAIDLATPPDSRWQRSRAPSPLLTPIGASLVLEAAVFAVWDLAREQPPPGRDLVYRLRAEHGAVAVAHTQRASLAARRGGPYLLIADELGQIVWRLQDPIWDEDLVEIWRELVEVAEGRSAVDESQIPPMPPLPWHQKRDPAA
ncbi:hypothetical protein AB0H43_12480 [Hamadaea sp. NPDC050747]|uniref:hypothetical protein n=1 Tax=Hamadaea sp. NPDC050747 TaxID=3155789 RepID=UPI0033EC6324